MAKKDQPQAQPTANTNGTTNGQHTNDRWDDAVLNAKAAEIVSNIVAGRQQWINRMTRGLDPRRDIGDECGYPRSGQLDAWKYQELYDREPIAGRVVEVMPKQSWQVQPSVYETEKGDEPTEFEKAWDSLAKQLRGRSWYKDEEGSPIWEYLLRLDILSGIGHYGVLFIGLNDGQPDLSQPAKGVEEENSEPTPLSVEDTEKLAKQKVQPPAQSVTRTANGVYRLTVNADDTKGRKITMLRALPETQCQVVQWEQNATSPRYGQPVMYLIYFADPESETMALGQPIAGRMVHWTRCLHVADTWHHASASEIVAAPRIKPVLNPVLDVIKIRGAGAEGYWQAAFNLVSFETNPQLGSDVNVDTTQMKDLFERIQNGLQRWFWTNGFQAKSIAPTISDPTPHIAIQVEAICIKLEMPIRIFKGSERGELASSQDDSSWNDRVQGRQLYYNTPRIVIPFIDRLIMLGVLPEPTEIEEKEVVDEKAMQAQDAAAQGAEDQAQDGEVGADEPPARPSMVKRPTFSGAKSKPAGIFNARRTYTRIRTVTRAVYNQMLAENGFCPTGQGGGIDNTCSSRGEVTTDTADDAFKDVTTKLSGAAIGEVGKIETGSGRYVTAKLYKYGAEPRVRIDFGIEEHSNTYTGKRLEAATVGMMRKLKEAVQEYHKRGFAIVIEASDNRRKEIYDKFLPKLGLKLKKEESTGKQVWNAEITANDFPPSFRKQGADATTTPSPFGADEEEPTDPNDTVDIEEQVDVPTKCVRTEAGYCIEWPDITSMSALDKATVFNTKMAGLSAAVSGGVAQLIGEHKILTEYGMDDEEADAALEEGAAVAEDQMGMDQQLMDEHGFKPDAAQAGMVDPEERDMQHEVEMAKAKNPGMGPGGGVGAPGGFGQPGVGAGKPPFPPKPGKKPPAFNQRYTTSAEEDAAFIANWCNQYGGDTCKDPAKNEATKKRLAEAKGKAKSVDKSKVKDKVKRNAKERRTNKKIDHLDKVKEALGTKEPEKFADFEKAHAELKQERQKQQDERAKEQGKKSIFRRAWDTIVGNAEQDDDEVAQAINDLIDTAEEQEGRDLTDDEIDQLVEEFLAES